MSYMILIARVIFFHGVIDIQTVLSQMDRVVANNKWTDLFRDVMVEGMPARSSDQKPIVLTIKDDNMMNKSGMKLFRFESSWIKEEEWKKVVEEEWEFDSSTPSTMESSLIHCSNALLGQNRSKGRTV